MGGALRREERGGRRRGEGGTARGWHGGLLGAPWRGPARSSSLLVAALRAFCLVRKN
jgi:hypothetical protein